MLQDRLSHLMREHRLGRNLVVVSRISGQWMLQNIALIGSDRATLQGIVNGLAQSGGLVRVALHYIRVVPSGRMFLSEGRAFSVPLDHGYFENIVSSPLLVAEDILDDIAIYTFVMKNYPDLYSKAPVHFEAIHGGGQNMLRVIDAKMEEKRIVVAIFDSDLKAPVSPRTKQAIIDKFVTQRAWPLLSCLLTPCAEAENFLNVRVLSAVDARISSSRSVSILCEISYAEEQLRVPPGERFELFFDMKRGLDISKSATSGHPETAEWITAKVNLAQSMAEEAAIAGFGDNILRRTLDSNAAMAEFSRSIRSKDWQDVFGPFVQRLRWLFIAPGQKRA